MDKIKILVIDKQVFARIGMKQALSDEPEFEMADKSPDPDLVSLIETDYPDVVLLDIDFPPEKGLALGRRITQCYPNIRLIILSATPDDSELFDVVKTGAVAYVDKNSKPADIAATVRDAVRGKYPINDSVFNRPKVAEQVLQQFQKLALQQTLVDITAPITQRETQILHYICNGNSNKQIADLLNISEQTIKNHVSSILRKLNANDRAHAAVLAVRGGLFAVPQQ